MDNGDGTWALTPPNPLAENSYAVTVTVFDSATNTSMDTTTTELIIDTTAPTVPTVTALLTNSPTPTIEGTAILAAGETLSVEVNGVTYIAGDGSLANNGDGTWSLTLPSQQAEGIYEVIARITDAAGNNSVDTSSNELEIDTTAPTTPTVNSLTTSMGTPVISGTTSVTPGETLTVLINGVTYTEGDGNLIVNADGTWSLTLPMTLPPGDYPIQISVTDAAGNTTVGEAGQLVIQPEADFDADGVPDQLDLDDDNDGIPDTQEGLLDSDGDGQPNYQDLDSDNDGIADIVEAGGEDTDNDYRVDNFIDRDNNGLSDDLQALPLELIDSDGDRVLDLLDLDSDNDGLTDLFESGGDDVNNDGRVDDFTDNNNDGADDINQATNASDRDSDGDGVPNRHDLDSDNDGLYDLVESGGLDTHNNGILDSMQDVDLDGIPDSVDASITLGADNDGDGIDDRFDVTFLDAPDSDGDGIIDSADPDANGDGFADDFSNNLTLGQALPDSNANGEVDVLDPARAGLSGNVLTGLQGHGCSINRVPNGKLKLDPLFALLVLASIAYRWRRSRMNLS